MRALVSGADAGFVKGGPIYNRTIAHCRRQCLEACSADQSVQRAEKIFAIIFFSYQDGSRGTFVVCTASTRIAGPGAAMCCFLVEISLTNVIRTYT